MDESGATVAAATADPGPPSPLTGCYLLIVVGEPHTPDHREILLQRIRKGLLSWNTKDYIVDLEKELDVITSHGPEGEETKYGERLIQYASENLVTEILIHPAVSTLSQCMRNLLSSFTRHRHIIHAGYTFATNGSWAVQDGTFSLADFTEAFQELEVQRILRAYDGNISIDIHCAPEGEWHILPKETYSRHCKVRINPTDIISSSSVSIAKFVQYLSPYLLSAELEATLESSEVVGNIRFSHPTLYVFPGGQGDAALFGINGFNMLLDGGFSRKACFWDFVRHLDRLDAVLLSRLNNSNICGISSVLERKRQNAVYPQIGHFFCNLQDRKNLPSPDGDKDKDPLIINLLDEGQKIITNLRYLNLTPQVCYRDSEPINLYHKVGHGTLDMYVLNPTKDSKEVKEFIQKWNENDAKMFAANLKANKKTSFPLPNKVSVCALLIWKPSNPRDQYTRILFPGSSPQGKIFEGLEKLRNLDCINYPICTEKTLSDLNIKSKKSKENLERVNISDFKPSAKSYPIDNRSRSKPRIPESKPPPVAPTIDNIQSSESKPIENGTNGIITSTTTAAISDTENKTITIQKSESTDSETSASKQKSNEKATPDVVKSRKPIDNKLKSVKSKIDTSKPKSRLIERKVSPTTPKKTLENKDVKDTALKPKLKVSPISTPAKSTKEANNRKVVESKLHSQPHKAEKVDKKEPIKTDRKPIGRKPRTSVPPSGKTGSSPKRVIKPDSFSKKIKLEKEATDSSTVSTPSIDQDIKRDVTKLTPEELEQLQVLEIADLKEDREVVEEIEAVFRKDEIKQKIEKGKIILDDKQEPEEYLIIEKEVIEAEPKDGETKKHAKDSEESEKPKETTIDETPTTEPFDKQAQDVKGQDMVSVDSGKDSGKSPEDKLTTTSSEKKTGQSKEFVEANIALESQPDERISATIESGATSAPTLPEDERITLDEIKEDGDQIIEEKHVKEDTKEKDIPTIQLQSKTLDSASPKQTPIAGLKLDRQTKIRDIVKTPDEVADLPVHEVVDIEHFEYGADVPKSITDKKETAEKISAAIEETEPEINNDLAVEMESELKNAVIIDTTENEKDVAADVEEPSEKQLSKGSSKRSSVDIAEKDIILKEPEIVDKHDLGRKSPKERESDVAKIVASVAVVLKSDAPLEEFEGKIPLDISSFKTYTAYTTELRETHITTVDSPIEEKPAAAIESIEPQIDTIVEEDSDVNLAKDKEKSPTSVHRMLVTASSEDGGEETLICTSKKSEEVPTDDTGKISEEEIDVKDQTDVFSLPVAKPKEAISEEDTSKESTLPTEELKEVKDTPVATKAIKEDQKPIKPDELQVSKDIQHDGKTTPTIEIDTVEDIDSGTSSPDEKVLSNEVPKDDATIEKLMEEDNEGQEKEKVATGREDSPDDKKEEPQSKLPDIPTRETSVDTETSVSPLTSGKSSPDRFDKDLSTPISSGKVTPDIKLNGEDNLLHEEMKVSEAIVEKLSEKEVHGEEVTKETSSTALSSGKASPDSAIVKDSSKSPDLQPATITCEKESSDIIAKTDSAKSSGKQTPEHVEDKKPSSTPHSSGKASPDIVSKPDVADSSRKQTPEHVEDKKPSSTAHRSGKASPDIVSKPDVAVSSSKQTPDKEQTRKVSLSAVSSGRHSPDPLNKDITITSDKSSGKQSPEYLDKGEIISGKQSPDMPSKPEKNSETTQSLGKQSPVATEVKESATSSKRSSVASEIPLQQDGKQIESVPGSGKVTPELIHSATDSRNSSVDNKEEAVCKIDDSRKSSITTKEKLDEDKVDTVSIKSTVSSGKQSPLDGKMKLDDQKSGPPSGRQTPEKLELLPKEEIKSAISSGKQSPESTLVKTVEGTKAGDISEKLDVRENEQKSAISSGKASPIIPQSETEKEDSRKSSVASEKILPEKLDALDKESVKSGVSSGKQSPDIVSDDICKKSTSTGKSSPAVSKEDKNSRKSSVGSDKLTEITKEVDLKSEHSSGKQSPDIPTTDKTDKDSRKASIDSDRLKSSYEDSGKQSPKGEETKSAEHGEDIKSAASSRKPSEHSIDVGSGKVEVKESSVSSGKTSAHHGEIFEEVIKEVTVEKTEAVSGKASPQIKEDEFSRKTSMSSEKEKEIDDKTSLKSGISSGKVTPDIPTSEKDSRKSSVVAENITDKQKSPGTTDKQKSPETTDDHEGESIGKSSGTIMQKQLDQLETEDKASVKSEVSSGKQTPDKVDHISEISLKPTEKESSMSEKHSPVLSESRKSSVVSEKPPSDGTDKESIKSGIESGKQTPDIPLEKMSRKSSLMSDKLPSDVIDKDSIKSSVSSGKQSPDIPAIESSRKSSATSDKPISVSGKETPEIPVIEQKGSRKSSVTTEPPQEDPELAKEIIKQIDETMTIDSRKSSVTSEKSSTDLIDKEELKSKSGSAEHSPIDTRKSSVTSEKPSTDLIDKEELKSISGSGEHSPIDTRKSSVASDKLIKEVTETTDTKIDCRKTSVELEDSKLADDDLIKSHNSSEKHSPSETVSRKQSVVSEKDKPTSELDQSVKSGVSSGKQTPNIPESEERESIKSDQLEIDDKLSTKSGAGSGKHTPEILEQDLPKDHGALAKDKIDIGDGGSTKSGASKHTLDTAVGTDESVTRKSSTVSEKVVLEVENVDEEIKKSSISSGKKTPEVSPTEKDISISDKQTPEAPAQEPDSRKSSIAKVEQLQIDEKDIKSDASSGKQSPEILKEVKSTTSSGRQTPDQADSTKSLAGSEQQTPDNAPVDDKPLLLKTSVSPILSGKVTPDPIMDVLEPIKSTSTSGRVTPEITIEHTSPTAPIEDEFLPIIAQEEKIDVKNVEKTESTKTTQEIEIEVYNGIASSISINGKSSDSLTDGEAFNGDLKKIGSPIDDISTSISTVTDKKSCIDTTIVESTSPLPGQIIDSTEDIQSDIVEDHFLNGMEKENGQIDLGDSRKSSVSGKPHEKSFTETAVDAVCEITKEISNNINNIATKVITDSEVVKKSEVTESTEKPIDKAHQKSMPIEDITQKEDKVQPTSLSKDVVHKDTTDMKKTEPEEDETNETDVSTDKFKYVDTFLMEEKSISAVHSDDPQKSEKIEKPESTILLETQTEAIISKSSIDKLSMEIIDDIKDTGDSIASTITSTDKSVKSSEKLGEIHYKTTESTIDDISSGITSTSEAIAKSVSDSVDLIETSIAESIAKTEESSSTTKESIKNGMETATKEIKEGLKESKVVLDNETSEKCKEQISKEIKDISESIQEKSTKVIEEVYSTIDTGKSSIETAKFEAEATVKEVIDEAKSTIESGKHTIDSFKTEIKEDSKALTESAKTIVEELKSVCDDKIKDTVEEAKVIEKSAQKTVETLKTDITDDIQKLKDVTQCTTESIKKSGEEFLKDISKEVHSKEEQVKEKIDTLSKDVEKYNESVLTSCDTKIKEIAKDLETTKETVKTSIDTLSKQVSDDAKQIKSNIKESVFETVKMGESLLGKFTKDLSDTVKSSTSSITSSLIGGKKEEKSKLDSNKVEALDKFDKGLSDIKDQKIDPMSASIYGTLPAESGTEPEASSSSEKTSNLMMTSFIGSQLPQDPKETKKDPIASWGKPLGLPSPIPTDNKGTPKKERKLPPAVSVMNRLNDKKNKKINPIYVELSYVPHHGNSNYTYVDFFKKVRARYYVFSGIEPSKEVYDALLEAKMSWEDSTLEVTIIPTYDTDVLGYWVAENEDALAKYKIDLSPSASRCTINLQDHETSCSAYRLEF